MTTTETYAATMGGAVRRIRTPHPHDVLSGRGGGINAHPGNVVFREWVRVRKEDYNLAPNKVGKTEVAMQVMQQVRDQDPPGRFLQRDASSPGTSWWIEVSDERALAKTSQALREGAPQIRLAHKDELQERIQQSKAQQQQQQQSSTTTKNTKSHHHHRKRKAPSQDSSPSSTIAPSFAAGGSSLTKRLAAGSGRLGGGTPAGDCGSGGAAAGGGGGGTGVLRDNQTLPSRVIPAANYRAIEKLQENARAAAAQSLVDEDQGQQDHEYKWAVPARAPFASGTGAGAGSTVDAMADTPPLVPHASPTLPGGDHVQMEPLNIGLPRETSTSSSNNKKRAGGGGGLTRVHSLALSDFSLGDITESDMGEPPSDDFVDPFADESDLASKIDSSGGSMLRNLSSSEDNGRSTNDYTSDWCVDLVVDENRNSYVYDAEAANMESEFAAGVKGILDAVHPSDWTTPEKEDDVIPTLLVPWRGINAISSGGGLSGRRSSSITSSSARRHLDGRQ